MAGFKAVLFAPDGDWVTDFHGSESVADVEERLSGKGSRWFFYPYEGIIADDGSGVTTDEAVIIAAPMWGPAQHIAGMTVREASEWIAENADDLAAVYA